ncbi:MAG: hypothetical protein GY794_20060, partial [bacterium]|nr:hypothetical protein [bacterium]
MAKKRVLSNKTAIVEPQRFAGGNFTRYCLVLCLLGAVTLAWLSLLTYSSTDPPARLLSPAKTPVTNAAGATGAYLAYTLRHYLGGGAYMGLGFATIAAIIMVFGGRVREWKWRLAGV